MREISIYFIGLWRELGGFCVYESLLWVMKEKINERVLSFCCILVMLGV